ncbi:MAG: hypothetical protein ACOCYE_04645 [Pseudomonadota bacterium]
MTCASTPCLAAGLALVLAAATVAPGAADAETRLRLGWTTSYGPQDPYAITAHRFAEALEARAPVRSASGSFPTANSATSGRCWRA